MMGLLARSARLTVKMNTVNYKWQLPAPIDAIVFDCDATLSQIEGIDVLAKENGVERDVHLLTEEAMGKTGVTEKIYEQRLDLVKPTVKQLARLGAMYYDHLTPDVGRLINVFHHLNKSVFVISAGIQAAVENFAGRLGIPAQNVFAVDVYFDENGRYAEFDHHSPMTKRYGKCEVIEKLKEKYPRILSVGDGINDVETASVVTRFVGYGGAKFRDHIANLCHYYIASASLLPIFPLTITKKESNKLSTKMSAVYDEGLQYIEEGAVLIHKIKEKLDE